MTNQNTAHNTNKEDDFVLVYDNEGKPIEPNKQGSNLKSKETKKGKKVRFEPQSDSETSDNEPDEPMFDGNDNNEEPSSDVSVDETISPVNNSHDQINNGSELKWNPRDVPFVLDMPHNYKLFHKLIDGQASSNLTIIFDRLLKSNDPSLREGNKRKLQLAFLYTLRYYDHFTTTIAKCTAPNQLMNDCSAILDRYTNALFRLAQINSTYAAKCCRALLAQHYRLFDKPTNRRPSFACLAFCQLLARLYPTSDYWHPIASPAAVLLAHVITKVKITNLKQLQISLIYANMFVTNYLSMSKRYSPEVISLIIQALYTSLRYNKREEYKDCLTGQITTRNQILVPKDTVTSCLDQQPFLSVLECFKSPKAYSSSIVPTLRLLLHLIGRTCALYTLQPSYTSIVQPIIKLLKQLPTEMYPDWLNGEIKGVIEQLLERSRNCDSLLTPLRRSAAPKKQMEFLEPHIETNFDPERPHRPEGLRGAKGEAVRLRKKYKREMRSAIREVRRDSQAIHREYARRQSQQDAYRNRKTRDIMRSLGGQEAEYKKMMRTKDTMKKRGIK